MKLSGPVGIRAAMFAAMASMSSSATRVLDEAMTSIRSGIARSISGSEIGRRLTGAKRGRNRGKRYPDQSTRQISKNQKQYMADINGFPLMQTYSTRDYKALQKQGLI